MKRTRILTLVAILPALLAAILVSGCGQPGSTTSSKAILEHHLEGEVAYIVWSSEPAAPLGTDTFIIRDGRIVAQTFAAHMVPSTD